MTRPSTTASTRLACLLGDPVGHSQSPRIHSAALAAAGIDAVYLAFRVTPDGLADAVEGLRQMGAVGCNLTIPHKAAVMALADEVTDEAAFIGAANCLHRGDDDRFVAANTDCVALQVVLAEDCDAVAGTPITIVGSGGAARAAAVAAGRLGAAVAVHARRPDAAAEVVDLARRAGGAAGRDAADAQIVINATPLGRHGERLPDPFMDLGPGRTALDLNYEDDPSPFLSSAQRAGGRAVDGLGMLVGQAEVSFALWFQQAAPDGVMRHAVAATRA